MRKYFISFSIPVLIAACGTGNNKPAATDSGFMIPDKTLADSMSGSTPNGSVLITKYDCSTCHKVDKKLIGPAFKDVANKYAGNDTAVTYLAHKVINGGGGVWGKVPMSKHINLSESDAEKIIEYILSLKTK